MVYMRMTLMWMPNSKSRYFPRQVICGSWESIACSAATAPSRKHTSDCCREHRSIWWSPIRHIMSTTKAGPEKSRTITCRTTSSTNSYMMRFPACTPSWQTMPASMCFTPTPRDLTLGKPSRMPVFIYPAAASG